MHLEAFTICLYVHFIQIVFHHDIRYDKNLLSCHRHENVHYQFKSWILEIPRMQIETKHKTSRYFKCSRHFTFMVADEFFSFYLVLHTIYYHSHVRILPGTYIVLPFWKKEGMKKLFTLL